MIPPLQLGSADYEQIGMILVPIAVAFAAWMAWVTRQLASHGAKLDLIMEYFRLKPKK